MNIKKRFSVICILVLSLIASGCGSRQRLELRQIVPTLMETPRLPVVTGTPTLHPSLLNCIPTPVSVLGQGVPNTPKAQEVIKTVQKSEEIYMQALITSDPSKFQTVFINDPRFPLSPKNLDTVRRLSNRPSLQSAGYLDYEMAYATWQIKEGRFIAKSHLHTPEPSQTVPPDFVWRSNPNSQPELRVLSMNIDGDIATIVIEEGVETYELTLVFVNGQWFIAMYKGISVSP